MVIAQSAAENLAARFLLDRSISQLRLHPSLFGCGLINADAP